MGVGTIPTRVNELAFDAVTGPIHGGLSFALCVVVLVKQGADLHGGD
jgi:hypothetical protein